MRVEGIGPSTSVLSGQRSTTELHTQGSTHSNQQLPTQGSMHSNQQLPTQGSMHSNQQLHMHIKTKKLVLKNYLDTISKISYICNLNKKPLFFQIRVFY